MAETAQQLDIEEVPTQRKPRGSAVAKAATTDRPLPTPAKTAMTPMEMLNAAIERGDSLDKLERLMDLNDRWEKAQAKKAFIEAKAAFKAAAPTIIRDKENKQYKSTYASIGNVVNTVNAALSKYGLDADWDYDQANGIKVTCKLTHMMGHSESVSLSGPPDTSGAKNPLQQIKSTLTYLRLATFEAVTGIATKEGNADDDGNASGAAALTDTQIQTLFDLITETNSNIDQFLIAAKVPAFEESDERSVDTVMAKLAEIRPSEYQRLENLLNAKKRKAAKS